MARRRRNRIKSRFPKTRSILGDAGCFIVTSKGDIRLLRTIDSKPIETTWYAIQRGDVDEITPEDVLRLQLEMGW